jgi:predicted aminopeptidase
MRAAKAAVLAGASADYDTQKASWCGYKGFDAWMARGLNNARLTSIATYQDLVPAFEGLLAAVGGDLPTFYTRAREVGALPAGERLARLHDFAPYLQAKAASP